MKHVKAILPPYVWNKIGDLLYANSYHKYTQVHRDFLGSVHRLEDTEISTRDRLDYETSDK